MTKPKKTAASEATEMPIATGQPTDAELSAAAAERAISDDHQAGNHDATPNADCGRCALAVRARPAEDAPHPLFKRMQDRRALLDARAAERIDDLPPAEPA